MGVRRLGSESNRRDITDQRKYYSMVEPESMGLHGKTACESTQLIESLSDLLQSLPDSESAATEKAEICSLIYRLNAEKNEAEAEKHRQNSFSGLCESFSIPEILPPPVPCIPSTASDTPENSAVFYNISKGESDTSSKEGDPVEGATEYTNRKYPSHRKTIIHNGGEWDINSKPDSGIYTDIMHGWLNELEWYQEKYRRVLVIVFQLHHKGHHYPDNSRVTKFFAELKKEVLKYCKATGRNTQEIGYFWRLEYGKTGAQHYHGGLAVDGNAARKAHAIKLIIDAAWAKVNDCPTHVQYPTEDFYKGGMLYKGRHEYYLDGNDNHMPHMKNLLIYHMSYFAKESPRCLRAAQVKDSGKSQNAGKTINVRGRKAA